MSKFNQTYSKKNSKADRRFGVAYTPAQTRADTRYSHQSSSLSFHPSSFVSSTMVTPVTPPPTNITGLTQTPPVTIAPSSSTSNPQNTGNNSNTDPNGNVTSGIDTATTNTATTAATNTNAATSGTPTTATNTSSSSSNPRHRCYSGDFTELLQQMANFKAANTSVAPDTSNIQLEIPEGADDPGQIFVSSMLAFMSKMTDMISASERRSDERINNLATMIGDIRNSIPPPQTSQPQSQQQSAAPTLPTFSNTPSYILPQQPPTFPQPVPPSQNWSYPSGLFTGARTKTHNSFNQSIPSAQQQQSIYANQNQSIPLPPNGNTAAIPNPPPQNYNSTPSPPNPHHNVHPELVPNTATMRRRQHYRDREGEDWGYRPAIYYQEQTLYSKAQLQPEHGWNCLEVPKYNELYTDDTKIDPSIRGLIARSTIQTYTGLDDERSAIEYGDELERNWIPSCSHERQRVQVLMATLNPDLRQWRSLQNIQPPLYRKLRDTLLNAYYDESYQTREFNMFMQSRWPERSGQRVSAYVTKWMMKLYHNQQISIKVFLQMLCERIPPQFNSVIYSARLAGNDFKMILDEIASWENISTLNSWKVNLLPVLPQHSVKSPLQYHALPSTSSHSTAKPSYDNKAITGSPVR